MKLDDKVYALKPHDGCLLLPSMKLAGDVYNSQTPPYQSLWFSHYGEFCSCGLFNYHSKGKWDLTPYCYVISPQRLSAILIQIHQDLQRPPTYPDLMQRGLLFQIAATMAQALTKPLSTEQISNRISLRALLYMEENYSQKLTVTSLAQALHISPSYLAEMFKRETGQTVVEALTEIRLRHARQLLMRGQLPMRAVARAVGYKNRSHFSCLFRERTGLTPGQYGK